MASSLCPGYKHVEEFGPDENYEDEEEVTYVTLDLGNIEPTLVPSSSTYRLIGLDTPTPYLQLSGTILQGQHDTLLGSELLFTDNTERHEWSKRSVEHVAVTEQRVRFREVHLQPKSATENKPQNRADEEVAAEEDGEKLDRLTGRLAPVSRSRTGNAPKSTKKKPRKKAQNQPTTSAGAASTFTEIADDAMDVDS